MPFILTLIAAILIIIGLFSQSIITVIILGIFWIIITQDFSQMRWNIKSIFKRIFWILIFGITISLTSEINYVIYFLIFFFINRFGMVQHTSKYRSLSIIVFICLCTTIHQISVLVLSVYWYFFYRHHQVASYLSPQQPNRYKINLWLEMSYYFSMLASIACAMPAASYSYYRHDYHPSFNIGLLCCFTLLSVLAYIKRRQSKTEAVCLEVEKEPLEKPHQSVEEMIPESAPEQNQREIIQTAILKQRETKIATKAKVDQARQKTKEFWQKTAEFIKGNIANILLLFGMLFILTGLVTFLRSNWQQFKYIIFACYCLFTLGLFTGGYYLFRNKKHLQKLSFVLCLLATIFFPFVFYFAVKIGLLHDHGNKYTVFWLTTFIAAIHSYIFRSASFTTLSTILTVPSLFLTLQKFAEPYFEIYAFFFALLALLQFAIHFIVQDNKKCKWTLIVSANVIFICSAIASLLFWDTYIFMAIMCCGIGFSLWQIRTTITSLNAYFYGQLLAITSLGLAISVCYAANLSIFWIAIPTVSVAFLLTYTQIGTKETHLALHHSGFITPIILFFIYVHYGAYSSYDGQWPVLIFSIISSLGYISRNTKLQRQSISYYAIVFHLLAIVEILKILDLDVHIYSCIFLVWATIAAYISTKKNKQEWITKPLQHCSLWIMPLTLLYLIMWGHDFYYSHFFTMCIILLMTSVFCIYTAILLRRKDLVAAGVAVFITLCTIVHNYHDFAFHYLSSFLVFFSIIALYVSRICTKRYKINISENLLSFILIPIVTTFSLISVSMAIGNEVWEIHIVLILSVLFFVAKYSLHPHKIAATGILLYLSLSYFMLTCNGRSFFDWGIYFSIFAAVLMISTKYLLDKLAIMIERYAYVLFIICGAQFLAFIRFYYNENIFFPVVLVTLNAILAISNTKKWLIYSFFANMYALYFFILPRNLFAFEYALFFIPLATVIFSKHKHFPQQWIRPAWQVTHATILFFLMLPITLPGMVPSAAISMWVIALAFVFYFVCLHHEKKPLYSYISTSLFSGCALVALFASKSLWGAQIALAMTIISALITAIGYLVLQKQQNIAKPIFHIVTFNIILIASTLVFIGKIDYPTLFSLLLCSIVAASIVYSKTIPAYYNSICAFFSMVLFAFANYLLIEKIDLAPLTSGIIVISLACAHLILAKVFREIPSLQKSFFTAAILLPLLSLLHAHNSIHITMLMLLTSGIYLMISYKNRDVFFAQLGFATALVACYSSVAYISFDYESFMVLSITMGIALAYASHFMPKPFSDYAADPLTKIAYSNYLVFAGLFLANTNNPVYFTATLAIVNSVAFLLLYLKTQKHLVLASGSFAFSYYVMLFSWATSVWELYTVPLGMIVIAYAFYLHKKHSFVYYKDVLFVGLLLIFVPTFIQSYHGWFDHLYTSEFTLDNHLTHSFFLIIESIVILLFGAYRKELLFFFTGLTFLLADIALVLFTYINFGSIHQSVWWASLGFICLFSWIITEYKKEWLQNISRYIKDSKNKWQEDLKSWN
ncbi:hypothetical protein [Candidatus Uabimicrobium sp. HlEnr_7]|uniref:hypothetical protein n=1 Tax=Candidatus Uabimicrobium helgolandensis TaxID=3095367 RepID=UPI00355851AB